MKDRLVADKYDLMIICGCAEKFYQKLKVDCDPKWLYQSPFNLNVPKNDPRTAETYNRELFYYYSLTDKFDDTILQAHSKHKHKFSFGFTSEVLEQYYGMAEDEGELGEGVAELAGLQITDAEA